MPKPRVAVLGMGLVGARAARELVSAHPEVSLALHSARAARRDELVRVFGEPIRSKRVSVHSNDAPLASTVELVVLTGDQGDQVRQAEVHLRSGRSVVTTVDSHSAAAALGDLDGLARSKDATLVVGACFSPGLTDLLAAYGATRMDSVAEVHFARHGAGGAQCGRDRLDALARPAHVWREGSWVTHRPGSGRQLCWFPDPVGGRDAFFADTAEPLLAVSRWSDLERCSARLVASLRDRLARCLPLVAPATLRDPVGAVRVELRGLRGGEWCTLVLGSLDRPTVACGVVISEVVTSILAGEAPKGVLGVGSLGDPAAMLRRLRVKGVRVAVLGEAELPVDAALDH